MSSHDPKRLFEDPAAGGHVRDDLARALATELHGYDAAKGLARLAAATAVGAAAGTAALGAGTATKAAGLAGVVKWGVFGGAAIVAVGLSAHFLFAHGHRGAAVTNANGGANASANVIAMGTPSAVEAAPATPKPAPTAPDIGADLPPADLPASPAPVAAAAHPARTRPFDRGSSPSASEPTTDESVAREVALLGRARAALSFDPAQALRLTQQGQREFPRGVLREEREAIAVLALVRLGRSTEASARGQSFVARYPNGPFTERVRLGLGSTLRGDDSLKAAGAAVVVFLSGCTSSGAIGILPGSEDSATNDGGGGTAGSGCTLPAAAFCDTFDAPHTSGARSGQLDPAAWGASRARGGGNNLGQGLAGAWGATPEDQCGQTVTVRPEADIVICDGHLVEATNDDHDATGLAMYMKQPFDIAGRTGTVVFDVSNDSGGTHRAWPELWFTDEPVPVPRVHDTSWVALPRDGVGIQLAGSCLPDEGCGACPGTASYPRIGFSAAFVSHGYALTTFATGDPAVTVFDCVAEPFGPDERNHFEIHVSQARIDLYGADAGTTAPLKKLVTVSGADLSLTRGFLSIVDAHFDGNIDGTDPQLPTKAQGVHTFTWDNVGFDGPVVARARAFDVPDALTAVSAGVVEDNGYPSVNLGWSLDVLGGVPSLTLTVDGVSGGADASGALVTLDLAMQPEGADLTYSLNGNGPHVQAWPYPDTSGSSWRTLALSVPLADVVSGTNTLRLGTTSDAFFANVDLVLLGAGAAP